MNLCRARRNPPLFHPFRHCCFLLPNSWRLYKPEIFRMFHEIACNRSNLVYVSFISSLNCSHYKFFIFRLSFFIVLWKDGATAGLINCSLDWVFLDLSLLSLAQIDIQSHTTVKAQLLLTKTYLLRNTCCLFGSLTSQFKRRNELRCAWNWENNVWNWFCGLSNRRLKNSSFLIHFWHFGIYFNSFQRL